jgi:hypothetical protein
MLQSPGDLCFAEEAASARRVIGVLGLNLLKSDLSTKLSIFGY